MNVLVLLQPILKPRLMQYYSALVSLGHLALKGMLKANITSVLLSDECADYGILAAT